MKKLYALLLLVLMLTGCASVQQPVALHSDFWQQREHTIGIAVVQPNKPGATMLGAQGLLDIAINQANAKSLITYLEGVQIPRLHEVAKDFGEQLQARGFKVKMIEKPLDMEKIAKFSGSSSKDVSYASRDFRSFKAEGMDRLIVISVNRVGTTRGYYGFMPLGPPQADIAITGQMVNLDSNQILWYQVTEKVAGIAEPWDQGPGFENVGKSVLSNAEQGVEEFEQAFFLAPAAK